MSTETKPQLIRALKLRDLVLLNLVAVLGLRHLGTSAKAGPTTLLLWVLAALFFFVPQGLAVIELSSRFPASGGIYDWTKRALGEWHGFVCGWCYWINNVLYYPSLLISAAVIATYIFGYGGTPLETNVTYVTLTTLVCLWLAVAVNIRGVGTGKWLQNAGGIGTYIPGALVILCGAYAWFTQPAANPIAARDLLPKATDYDSLNLWISIAFAYAGLELSATLGDEIENPRRNLPLSIYISAPLIALMYFLGTASVLWLVKADDINVVSAFLQATENGISQISPALKWLVPVCAALYTIGNIGGVGAWLSGPARVAFAIGLDRYFPPAFGKVHPRWQTPYVAILVQAVLATVFLLVSQLGKGSTVEHAYLVLLDTQLLVYFIPYVYLFLCLLRQARVGPDAGALPGGRAGATLAGLSGLGITLFAMVVAAIPPGDAPSRLVFGAKVIGGASAFVVLGGAIYWRARGRRRA